MRKLWIMMLCVLTAMALLAGTTAEGLSIEAAGDDLLHAKPVEDAVLEAEPFELVEDDGQDHAVAAGEAEETIDDEVVYDFTIEDGWLKKYEGDDKVIVVPDGVVGISQFAFYQNKTAETIVLPEGLTEIGESAFKGFGVESKLKKVNIPSTVTRIGDSAFGYSSIEEIVIPESVKVIGDRVFDGCTKLEKVTWPSSLSTIPGSTFSRCTNLKSFNIPGTVTTIGQNAFSQSGLTSIVIPESVTQIDSWAFYSCNDLKSATVPGTVLVWQSLSGNPASTFSYCPLLTEVTLGEGLTKIPDSMFYGCTALKTIRFPSTITEIGNSAFEKCSTLKDIYIDSNILSTVPKPQNLFVTFKDNKTVTDTEINNIIFHTHCDTLTTQTLKKKGYTVSKTAHNVVPNEDVPATCLESGSRGGTHCTVCEAVITPAEFLPATGHSPVTDAAIPPTYSTTGLTEGVHCANCGAVIQPQQVVPMLTPEPTVAPTQAPTATPKPTTEATAKPEAVTGITLNKTGTVKLKAGKTLQLRAMLTPANASTTLTWKSSKPAVAIVNRSGKVTALKAGTATITAKTANGKTAKVKIKVSSSAPTGIKLNKKNTVTLKKGKTLQLKATLEPEGATGKLTWTSSDKKVAKVSSKGKVTALKAGTATITVKTDNKKSAKVKIKVK